MVCHVNIFVVYIKSLLTGREVAHDMIKQYSIRGVPFLSYSIMDAVYIRTDDHHFLHNLSYSLIEIAKEGENTLYYLKK
jgi:hypothetical protein